MPTLVHELGVDENCHPLQGNPISVCLGLLDLDGTCYLEFPNPMTHFLLLPYGGIQLRPGSELIPPADIVISSARRALKKLNNYITHRDLRVESAMEYGVAVCHDR